jgi:hypothetical protein
MPAQRTSKDDQNDQLRQAAKINRDRIAKDRAAIQDLTA